MTTELAPPVQHQHQAANKIASSSLNSTTKTTTATGATKQAASDVATLNESSVKFPLENGWSFWFYKNDKTKEWKENIKFIATVEFVEDFWGVYNHIQLVSCINVGCDYMFFKKDIPPMWEDHSNRDGGRWVVSLDKKQHHSLDIYWLNTLLAMVGDQFIDESPYVNGLWINVRPKADKIALWTRNADNADVQYKIGRKFKELLEIKDGIMVFEKHGEDSYKKGGDNKPLYQL